MKVTIELSEAEVKGIKAYLLATGEAATKEDVKQHIQGIVSATLYAPSEAISDYILQASHS